jgi:omega-amidase
MQDLKITIIQSELFWEDSTKNLDQFSKKISSINEATDLILLPEMFTTGFTMNAKTCAEEMDGKSVAWMKATAKEKKCVITGSLIISENGNYYNRLIWMKPDGTNERYDKHHLFPLAEEQKTYSAGNKKIITEINGWKICPLVCFDLRFPVWNRRTKQEDYDLLLFVANWPERRIHAWKQLLIARAIENQSYVAGVNRIGNDGNMIYHSGHSAVIDFKGEQLSKTKPGEESIETILLNKQTMMDFRKNFPFAEDADEFIIRQ